MQIAAVRYKYDLRARMPDPGLELLLNALLDLQPLEGIPRQLYDQLAAEAALRKDGRPGLCSIEFDLSAIPIDAIPAQVAALFRIRSAGKNAREHLAPPEEWFILDAVVEFLFGVTRQIGGFFFPTYPN